MNESEHHDRLHVVRPLREVGLNHSSSLFERMLRLIDIAMCACDQAFVPTLWKRVAVDHAGRSAEAAIRKSVMRRGRQNPRSLREIAFHQTEPDPDRRHCAAWIKVARNRTQCRVQWSGVA